MATRRSGQLVQRSVASSDKNPDANPDEERAEGYESDEAGDKKEVRLTLMEEVLLLGLKDREVKMFDSLFIVNVCSFVFEGIFRFPKGLHVFLE